MNTGDAYFLLLYLVSVFQPVTRDDLFAEALKAAKDEEGEGEMVRRSDALKRLIRRQLVIEDHGFLSCTVLGTQRAAKLGLRKVRDKNRLFFLKNLLRREYNDRR